MRFPLAAFLSLFLLAACAGPSESLTELRHATPARDPYLAALANEYMQLSEQKTATNEWATSKYFADKGLKATYGHEVDPEDPAQWQIPPSSLTALNSGREKLMAAVEQNKTTQPALTAQAVANYDRWLEAVANNPSAEEIDAHNARFASALEKLGQVQVAQPGTHAPISEPGVVQGKNATILYFPFDSDQLGLTAKAAVGQVAKRIQATNNVNINGHADRAGSEAYNQDLSERRAKFVEKALKAAGAPASALHYFAFGESDPAVPTADGVEEPKNRRVEIVIE